MCSTAKAFKMSNLPMENYKGRLCFRCDSKNLVIDYQSGDLICSNCGEIVSDRMIYEGNEVRTYADDEGGQTSRTSGMSESIGYLQTLFLTGGTEATRKSLEKAQSLTCNRKETTVINNRIIVKEMCSKMNLSASIHNEALDLFSKCLLEDVIHSKQKEPIAAACIYIACKKAGYPRTIEEVSLLTAISKKDIQKYQSTIAQTYKLNLGRVYPENIVNRMSYQLSQNHLLSHYSQEFCRNITKNNILEGSAPQFVAAGVLIYVAIFIRETISLDTLSNVSLVPIPSLQHTYSQLHPIVLSGSIVGIVPKELLDLFQTPINSATIPCRLDGVVRNGMTIIIPKVISSVNNDNINSNNNSDMNSDLLNDLNLILKKNDKSNNKRKKRSLPINDDNNNNNNDNKNIKEESK